MHPGADCDTDHQLLMAMLTVGLANRQREHSIMPLNLEEEKAEHFAAEVTKSQKKKKWISDETFVAIREKREAKGKDKNRYQELKAEVQRMLRVDKQQ